MPLFFKKISQNFGESTWQLHHFAGKGHVRHRTRPSTAEEWLSLIVFIILSTLACKLSMRASAWLATLGYSTRSWSSDFSWFFSFPPTTPNTDTYGHTQAKPSPNLFTSDSKLRALAEEYVACVRSKTCWVCRWGMPPMLTSLITWGKAKDRELEQN